MQHNVDDGPIYILNYLCVENVRARADIILKKAPQFTIQSVSRAKSTRLRSMDTLSGKLLGPVCITQNVVGHTFESGKKA